MSCGSSLGFALAVIGVTAITLMGVWRGLVGILLPATAILAATLAAAIDPAIDGGKLVFGRAG